MKKLFFSMLYLNALVLPAVAQTADNRVWYNAYRDKECKDYATHYIMDRKAMEFHFDWDSDNEMLIKNYKKNGKTETFDAYYKEEPGKQFAHIVLVTGDTGSNITINIVEYSAPKEFYYLEENKKAQPRYSGGDSSDVSPEPDTRYSGGDSDVSPEPGKGSVKSSAKNLLNKGKNLFKKKN